MGGRKLRPEERTIWNKVARTVTPRRAGSAKPEPTRDEFAAMMRVPIPDRKPITVQHAAVDIRQDKKTRRGQVEIDGKIDLHDMTVVTALRTLKSAIHRAQGRRQSCLLVITGKGLRGEGVLKNSFPGWMNDPDIRPSISAYAPAHIRHGGSGAWYVFIRT